MLPIDTSLDWFDPDLAELEELSNGALDLIEIGRLDEAERMCFELKKRFPNQIDWNEHSAALYVARGQVDQAIAHYEQCLAHIDRYPDGFDLDSRAWYRDQIDRLLQQSERVGSE
jgi:tetratricopeptide (TPR) repeat protein